MRIRRFKNGNITIKRLTPLEKLCDEMQNIVIALLWSNKLDLQLLGEQGCAGNYDMYQELYDSYTDRKYMLLLGKNQEEFEQGKTVRLYATKLDEYDRTLLQKGM